MRQVFGWMLVLVLGCATGRVSQETPDARLVEAQADFDTATKLKGTGEYSKAFARAEHALALREAALGTTHPDVASCLELMGDLHRRQGHLNHAEPLLKRALAIYEAARGKSHPDVAASLNSLAVLYSDQGLYDQAEPLFRRALTLRKATLGHKHPLVAASLNNLAVLYMNQGLYSDRAEPLYWRSLAIREAALGKNHPDVAQSLNNLANLYTQQGLYAQAEPLFLRSLTIREEVLGKLHPDVAQSLDNLASFYALQDLYSLAEPLFLRSLILREAALGKSHPDVAQSLDNLASSYALQGLYDRAEPLFLRSLSLREATLGKSHPLVATSLGNLAQFRLAQHRLADALHLYTRAFSISEQRLRREAIDFSESRLSSFLRYLRASEETLYALLRTHPEDAHAQRLALSAVLLLKGRSVAETANISRIQNQSLSSADRDTFERLRGLRTQLATLSLEGPGARPTEAYQQRRQALADEGDSLEAELAKRSAPLRALTALPPPSQIVDRVAAALPKDGALVELIAYRDSPLVPKPGTPLSETPSQSRYLALVLFPDASTRAVDLGPAAPIDAATSRLRDALAHRDDSYQATAQELYRLAFQPLRRLLGSTRRILLSPDGQLGLVPFSALHDGQGFLLDSFDFTYLTSGRELLPRPQESAPATSVVVLADPDFSAAPPSAPSDSRDSAPPSDALERFFSSSSRADLPRSSWVPLPGARKEARDIQLLMPQAQLFLGPEATKERLLHLPTPGILHLATHGFFLGNAPPSASGSLSAGVVETPSGSPRPQKERLLNLTTPGSLHSAAHKFFLHNAPSSSGSRSAFPMDTLSGLPPPQQEPLLNSGLVMAGARATDLGASAPRADATLVTALELAGLDLWGTQLVVLSACDTGRGEVHLGQGIYGLRRALVVAGAETVVMSLWKVNDDSTHLLMDFYYRNLLAGQGRASALREAMRSLRASHPHPHDWAPFIALGSDAPLHAITPSAPRTPKP